MTERGKRIYYKLTDKGREVNGILWAFRNEPKGLTKTALSHYCYHSRANARRILGMLLADGLVESVGSGSDD